MSRRFRAPAPAGPLQAGATPSFSVIVAAYQAAPVIGDAIESALAQTRPPLEVVVCDDGSTDGTAQALARFGERIVLLHQQNGGAASARNAATRAARGDFVVILDADDVFLPERLEAIGELAAARPDLDVITTDAHVLADGQPFRRTYELGNEFVVDDQRRAILQRNFVFGLAAVRRSALLAAGGFDESIARTEDWDLWIRLVLTGSRIGLVDEPLAEYRLRPDSLSADQVLLLRGRCQTLAKTAASPLLTAAERALVRRTLAAQRRQLALAEARRALVQRQPEARRRAAAIVVGRGYGVATRLKSAVSALAPELAARRLLRAGPLAARTQGGFRTAGRPPSSSPEDDRA